MRYNFTHEDLKHCPFCGDDTYVEVEKKIVQTVDIQNCYGEYRQEWEARWNVQCTNPYCGVHPKTRDCNSLSEAVELWNKRA